ncbi:uncharacterized protein LOC118478151 [Aplysia californica]|uniref:Uncharacterized protein LOC118478151 n=1 Tax=Aplysia californica TaxID=6500 RepID=A0ABM1VX73_APLCA|nr:uncharacterized protein LOC118478151 [Aplysia californica]
MSLRNVLDQRGLKRFSFLRFGWIFFLSLNHQVFSQNGTEFVALEQPSGTMFGYYSTSVTTRSLFDCAISCKLDTSCSSIFYNDSQCVIVRYVRDNQTVLPPIVNPSAFNGFAHFEKSGFSDSTTSLFCSYTWVDVVQKCIQVVDGTMTDWESARLTCQENSGDLLCLSHGQFEDFRQYLETEYGLPATLHIGLQYMSSFQEWQWVCTNTALSDTITSGGQPLTAGNNDQYAFLNSFDNYFALSQYTSENLQFGYICQY